MKSFAILSGEGRSFFDAISILSGCEIINMEDIIVLSDRKCPAIYEARNRGIEYEIIEDEDNKSFSTKAYEICSNFSAEFGIVSFSRLLTRDIYGRIRTLNVHPALLPAYKGLGALNKAIKDKVRFIGATLHVVIEEVDSGPIIAQTVSPIRIEWNESDLRKVSYIQKAYLFIVSYWMESERMYSYDFHNVMWNKSTEYTYTCNPSVSNARVKSAFNSLQKELGVNCIIP